MAAKFQNDNQMAQPFEAFYRENYNAISRFVVRRVPNELHDDVVAETFLVALKRFAVVNEPTIRWLYKIARFEVNHALRRLVLQSTTRIADRTFAVADISNMEAGMDVMTAMDSLSDGDCDIIRMVLWDEIPREEIAEVLACSVSTANVRYHRAIKRLRNILEIEPVSAHKSEHVPKGANVRIRMRDEGLS
jgi:RNA polymerase sigma-70 factor (ECF subfamily)